MDDNFLVDQHKLSKSVRYFFFFYYFGWVKNKTLKKSSYLLQ